MPNIRSYKELRVYQAAMDEAIKIFQLTKGFPSEERYSMIDQVRRSSRSVCANLAEAWRKRQYPKHFQSKLTDAESEAAETQVWIEVAMRCGYLNGQTALGLDENYNAILAQIVRMKQHADQWSIRS